MANILVLDVAVLLIAFVGIGYLSMSGNFILGGGERPSYSETPKNISLSETNHPVIGVPDLCKNVRCENSSIVCQDGTKVSCENICIDGGGCSSCNPDCTNHNKSIETPTPSPNATAELSSPTLVPNACNENWSCSDWSDCVNDIQTRSCVDSNNCEASKNKPQETQSCSSKVSQPTGAGGLFVSLFTNQQNIQRGSDVLMTARVIDGQNIVEGANIELTLTYASGTQYTNTSLTDRQGQFSWSKKIGGNAKSGTFKVEAKATKSGYLGGKATINFEVVNKTDG